MGKELEMEPGDFVEFKGPFKEPVSSELKVKNGTGKRMAFKLKCSENALFKIHPSMGVLKDGENATVTLTFTAKDKKAPKEDGHFFSLREFQTKNDTQTAREAWEDPYAKKVKQHKKVKVTFKDDDDKDDKDKHEADKEERKDDKEKKNHDEKEDGKKEDRRDDYRHGYRDGYRDGYHDGRRNKHRDERRDERRDECRDECRAQYPLS